MGPRSRTPQPRLAVERGPGQARRAAPAVGSAHCLTGFPVIGEFIATGLKGRAIGFNSDVSTNLVAIVSQRVGFVFDAVITGVNRRARCITASGRWTAVVVPRLVLCPHDGRPHHRRST